LKKVTVDGEYKIAVGCEYDPISLMEKTISINNEELQDTIEALIQIKRSNDGLALELTRTVGNKFDFHNLFMAVSEILCQ
jgi:hypothetical protein